MNVNRNIGVGAAQVDGHAGSGFFFGDSFDPVGDVLPAALEFVLELLRPWRRCAAVELIEDAAGD